MFQKNLKITLFTIGLNDRNKGSYKRPYTILSYANGGGFSDHFTVENGKVARVDLTGLDEEIVDFEYHFPATVPLSSETHSGADVGIFAKGDILIFTSIKYSQFYILSHSSLKLFSLLKGQIVLSCA